MATNKKFTAKWLDNLKPTPGKQVEYADAGHSGLRLRVSPGGTKTFYWYVKQNGKLSKINLGRYGQVSLSQARSKLEDLREMHQDGVQLQQENAPKTIKELAELFYKKRIIPHRKRPDVVRQIIDHDIIPVIGKKRLQTLTTLHIGGVVDVVVERGATAHASKVLATLKQLFGYAAARGFLPINIASPLEPKGLGVVTRVRKRSLDEKEIKAMWKGLDQAKKLSPIVRLGLKVLLLTGTRSGELRLARWEHIDLKKKEWFIPAENSKNGKEWTVTLSPLVISLFKEMKKEAEKSPWVMLGVKEVPITDKVMARAVKRLFEQEILKGEHWTPHDLRRTVRTHLSSMKVEPYIAEKCLNHSLGKLDEIYNQDDYIEQRREVMNRWSDKVARIVKLKNDNVVEIRA